MHTGLDYNWDWSSEVSLGECIFVFECGTQLAVLTDRSGEHRGLLRHADPAPLTQLWLQLTEAAKCEGGDWRGWAPDKPSDRFLGG